MTLTRHQITFVFTETMGITSLDVTKTTVLAAARESIWVPRGALACEVEEPQVNSAALVSNLAIADGAVLDMAGNTLAGNCNTASDNNESTLSSLSFP